LPAIDQEIKRKEITSLLLTKQEPAQGRAREIPEERR
jgi:hypothetical protein